jgi:hypothetical protein
MKSTAETKAKSSQKQASDHLAENSGKTARNSRGGNPENLKPFQFKPGQSGNPGGRRPKPLTGALSELLARRVPKDPKGRMYVQVIAQALIRKAAMGDVRAAAEIADRVEGKAMRGVEMSGREGGPLTIAMIDDILDPDKNEKRIHELVTKAGYQLVERPQ